MAEQLILKGTLEGHVSAAISLRPSIATGCAATSSLRFPLPDCS